MCDSNAMSLKGNCRRILLSERGDSTVSFAITFPIVILITLLVIDLSRYMSAKSLITRACSRGASMGTSAMPSVSATTGSMESANIYCPLSSVGTGAGTRTSIASTYFQEVRASLCSASAISPCPSDFAISELLSMMAAAQLLCQSNQEVLLPPNDYASDNPSKSCFIQSSDETGESCAWVIPRSFPNTDIDGTLKLECGMNVRLFSTGILHFLFSRDYEQGLPVKMIAVRNLSK